MLLLFSVNLYWSCRKQKGDLVLNFVQSLSLRFVLRTFCKKMFRIFVFDQVDDVKEWICKEENYKKIPETKLLVFLHDLTFHSVWFYFLYISYNPMSKEFVFIGNYCILGRVDGKGDCHR